MKRALVVGVASTLLMPLIGLAQYRVRVVAYEAQPAPGLPAGVRLSFGNADAPLITNTGLIAFRSTLVGPGVTQGNNQAWWVGSPDAFGVAVRSGQAASGAGKGAVLSELVAFTLNNEGDACLTARVSGPGITNPNASGVWVLDGTGLHPFAITGAPAPGAEGVFARLAGAVPAFSAPPAFNDRGEVALFASIDDVASEEPVDGVWVGTPADVRLAALVGSVPGGFAAPYVYGSVSAPSLAPDGRVFFNSSVYRTILPSNTRSGIWEWFDGVSEPFLLVGDAAPGFPAGVEFDSIGGPSCVAGSRVSFLALLRGITESPADHGGVWTGARDSLVSLVQAGDPMPGQPEEIVYGVVQRPCFINQSGVTAAGITWWENGGPQSAVVVGTPGDVREVCAANTHPAGTPTGTTFVSCFAEGINDAGSVLVSATVRGPGVDFTNHGGWWIGTPERLTLAIRRGMSVELPDGTSRVLSGAEIRGGNTGHDGHASGFNNSGQAVVLATFTDTSRAILLLEPPPVCAGDWDHSGVIDSNDFFAFIVDYFGGKPIADFNGSGQVNSQDFFDFLIAFFTPCQ